MARKQTQPEVPLINRKHVSRAERESERRRQIVLAFAAVAALLILVLGAGALYSGVIEPRQVVATVDDVSITRAQFYRRINYERFRLYRVIEDTRAQALEGLGDPQSSTFYYQIFNQQLDQLRQVYDFLPTRTLETMIEEELILKEAAARSITVSDAEIDEEIRRQMAQMAGEGSIIAEDVAATATGQANATATAASYTATPSPTVEPSPTATATATTGRTSPTPRATARGTGTPAATATAEATATATLEPTMTAGPTFTPAPTLTPNLFTEERFTPTYQSFLSEMRKSTGFTEADFREAVRRTLLRTKLQEAIASETEVETTRPEIHVAHILVATEEEAQAALEQLRKGESFEVLAAKVSTDTSNSLSGGDLGWIARDTVVAPFADAAFALTEPGQLSDPVQTDFGWHIIKLIEGPEPRPREDVAIQADRDKGFADWLSNESASNRVTRPWYDDSNPVLPRDPFARAVREPLPTPLPQPTQPVGPTMDIELTPAPGDATPATEATPAPSEATPATEATPAP